MFDEIVELPYVVVAPDGHVTATNSALDDLLAHEGSCLLIARVDADCCTTD